MTFAEALENLEERHEARIELGLDRLLGHLARLGDPHLAIPAIHVAGTNGKGSVCAMLDSALRAAGLRTGLYTSPHLESPRERIQVDGRAIAEADFARLLERSLAAEPKGGLTYFELLTSMAFQRFAEERLDAAVLETGLGGRLDATNAVEKPRACAITSIALDHTQLLGGTLAEIAAEKAGILKPGAPAVCPRLAPEAMAVIEEAARRVGAPLTVVEDAARLPTALAGRHQQRNAAVVRAVLDASGFRVGPEAFRAGLESVRWPGRFEVVRLGERAAILDGAHNPEAASRLAETWSECPWSRGPALWILGVLADKDAAGIVAALAGHLGRVVCVAPRSPRALAADKLAALVRRAAPRAEVTEARDAAAALEVWQAGRWPAAVVAGSFYLVSGASEALKAGAARG